MCERLSGIAIEKHPCPGCPRFQSAEPTDRIHCIDQTGKWMCWLKLDDLREALSRAGLAIVPAAAAQPLTAEERKVLEACAAMQLGDDDPDIDPLEPQEVGEDCYIYTDDQEAIARAELARRAAKGSK